MSPEAIAATERAIAQATTREQLDELERSLRRAYPRDQTAETLLKALSARRLQVSGGQEARAKDDTP